MISFKELFYFSLAVYMFMAESALAYKSNCSGGYCFVVSENSLGQHAIQSDAQSWCSSNKSQLVEIVNIDIQNALATVIQNAFGSNNYGTGLFFTNGIRSLGGWIRLSGANINGINIYDQTDASYAYAYLTSTASGFDIYASTTGANNDGYICSGVSDCTNGATINGQCYKANIELLSWYDARERCLDAGGDLASFDYITTNAEFNALNESWINTSKRYWIGIRRENWTWQGSKTDVKYSNWLSGHPTNAFNCLCLTTSQWQWSECNCSELYPFVCLSGSPTSPGSSTTTTTTPQTTSYTGSGSLASTTSHSTTSGSYESSTSTASLTNQTMEKKYSGGLSNEAKIGIGVGVGVGGFLIIIVVVVIIIFYKRGGPRMKYQRKPPTPDLISRPGKNDTYATVMESPELDANAYNTTNSKTPVDYAELDIMSSSPQTGYGNTSLQRQGESPYYASIK